MNLIAERLQYLLDQNNIKPATLAKAIDVNKSTISRILNGSAIPNVDTIFKAANFFDVKMEYFMIEENCSYATFDKKELELIDAYRQLSSRDQQEIYALIQFKLDRYAPIKGESKGLEKSTTSRTLEESATIEKMA